MAITHGEGEFLFVYILLGMFFSLIINALISSISPENSLIIGIAGVLALAWIFKLK
jgi:hypothetical protein